MDIYLDHNATTPVHPEVAQAMSDALAQTGNPSSVHRFGRLVRRTVDDAREDVARLVGANAANVVFTSGGTEANNQALRGFDRRVLVSAVEHDSVLAARDDVEIINVDIEWPARPRPSERIVGSRQSTEPRVGHVRQQ